MAVKKVTIAEVGEVSLYKRKGAKSMRLSVSHEGQIRLTMPKWAPYSTGVLFINNHVTWINSHLIKDLPVFSNNTRIGKAHTMIFISDNSVTKPTTRVTFNQIKILMPNGTDINSSNIQKVAKSAALRALKKQAEQLLPQRLNTLAEEYGFSYSQLKIKQLKSRWGSCNNLNQITLSFYLMQLPWDLIDYVILHELTHTKVLAHGKNFWDELHKYLPNAKQLRKEINTYKPVINTSLSV